MEYSASEMRAVLLSCCISGFIAPLLSTMMNLSLVNIGEEFDVGSHDLAYINSAFLLASVIFMVPLAKLADIIGKKKMFVMGLVVIVGGCIIACIAPNFWFVVIGRGVIGAGAASLATMSVSMIADVIPVARRGTAMGYQTMCIYLGLSMGPAIGGALNDLIGWRLLFLLSVPFAVASIYLMVVGFKGEIVTDPEGVLDNKASVLYGIAILLSMAGIMNLPQMWAIICTLVGIVLLMFFVRNQIGNPHCLLDMSLFKNWTFSGSCVATFMSYAANYSISFFLALYLQSIGQLSATESGFIMMFQPVVQCVLTPFSGKLTDRISNKTILPTIGMAITSISIFSYTLYGMDTPIWMVLMSMGIGGFGFALFSAPNTTVIMSSVPRSHSSEASGMMAVMRQTGMMVSMGVAMLFISAIMGSMDNLSPETYGSFLEVMHMSMMTCLIMCLIGMVTSGIRGMPKKV